MYPDCAASLWEWNKSLCEETDKWDWNPLHYAVKQGLRVVVRKMLGWKTSLAYTHAGNGNDWATLIHIAANEVARPFQRCRLRHCQLGRRDFEIKWKKMQKPEDETESKGMLKDIMEAAQMHLVVATLLGTVTFAADTIAFTCSAGAVFSYFYIAISAATAKRLKLITVRFKIAILLQRLAMSAVVIAFVTGMYATLAHSVGLAVTVCVIGCISFPLFYLPSIVGHIVKTY
ncbi:hypothetical protein BC332_14117 [Capsicum chinense]|nr:hypothetical protein BC332_14117 [Capsicum chinense]